MNKFFIFLLLIPLFGYSQNEGSKNDEVDLSKYKYKEVTLIWYADKVPNQEGCASKAIMVTSTGVVIDTCFSLKNMEVSNDITKGLDENDFYTQLLLLTKKDVKKTQADLDNFTNDCAEFPKPLILIISDEKGSETYGLKHLDGCFPEKSKTLMSKINELINSL